MSGTRVEGEVVDVDAERAEAHARCAAELVLES